MTKKCIPITGLLTSAITKSQLKERLCPRSNVSNFDKIFVFWCHLGHKVKIFECSFCAMPMVSDIFAPVPNKYFVAESLC